MDLATQPSCVKTAAPVGFASPNYFGFAFFRILNKELEAAGVKQALH